MPKTRKRSKRRSKKRGRTARGWADVASGKITLRSESESGSLQRRLKVAQEEVKKKERQARQLKIDLENQKKREMAANKRLEELKKRLAEARSKK